MPFSPIASLPYTLDLPVASNAPSQDVNNMTINTNSINSIWQTDHSTFINPNPGSHNQVQLNEGISAGNGAIPSTLIGNGFETIYSSVTAGSGDIWFTRGSSGVPIRLTGPGIPTPRQTIPSSGNLVSGFSFIPGGIIMQWGATVGGSGGIVNVTFPVAFPSNILSLTLGSIDPSTGIFIAGESLSGFSLRALTGQATFTSINWMAIGN